MKITLRYFGQLRQLAEMEEVAVEMAEGGSAREALAQEASLRGEEFGRILFDANGALRPSVMILRNGAAFDRAQPPALRDGDVLTVLPAIAGG